MRLYNAIMKHFRRWTSSMTNPVARSLLTTPLTAILQAPTIIFLICRAMLFRSLMQMALCRQSTSTPRGAR